MNDEQDPDSKSQAPGSDSQGGSSESIPPDADNTREGLNLRRNAAEIAGETVAVVGEATGQFQRPPSVERGERESTGKSAFLVGAGILISRIIGVIRQRVFGHYFGVSLAADALMRRLEFRTFCKTCSVKEPFQLPSFRCTRISWQE